MLKVVGHEAAQAEAVGQSVLDAIASTTGLSVALMTSTRTPFTMGLIADDAGTVVVPLNFRLVVAARREELVERGCYGRQLAGAGASFA